jgi:dethiobiotin synthetase
MLKHRMIPIAGLIFNGDENPETERIILHRTKVPCLLRIKREVVVDKTVISKYAKELNRNWNG